MRGVSGEPPARALAYEPLLRQGARRGQRPAQRLDQAAGAEAATQLEQPPSRDRMRSEQDAFDLVPGAHERLDELPVRPPVAPEARGRRVEVALQHESAAV